MSATSKRHFTNYFKFKAANSLRYIIKKWSKSSKLSIFDDLLKKDITFFEKIVVEVESSRIFENLVKSTVKIAHDNLQKNFTTVSEEIILVTSHQQVLHAFSKILLSMLVTEFLVHPTTQSYIKNIQEDLLLSSGRYIYQESYSYSLNNKEWKQHLSNSATILNLFVATDIFEESFMEVNTVTKKKHIKYKLGNSLDLLVKKTLRLPKIVKLHSLSVDDINPLIKPLIFGRGEVSKSEILKDVLNLSQSKRYKVDEQFVSIVKLVLIDSFGTEGDGFHLSKSRLKLDSVRKEDVVLQQDLVKENKEYFHQDKLNTDNYHTWKIYAINNGCRVSKDWDLTQLCHLTVLERRMYHNTREELKKLLELKTERKKVLELKRDDKYNNTINSIKRDLEKSSA